MALALKNTKQCFRSADVLCVEIFHHTAKETSITKDITLNVDNLC